MPTRSLRLEGAWHVRDLGGLRTRDGGRTQYGRVVRAGSLDALTKDGWACLISHGIRTVVDLRNDDERHASSPGPPGALRTVQLPLDGVEDREFWEVWGSGPQFGTPLFYGPHLDRMPGRSVAVLRAIAEAPPGGVVFHCSRGRDRTGLVAALLLATVGVLPEDAVDDYRLSADQADGLPAHQKDEQATIDADLAERGTTAGTVLRQLLDRDLRTELRRAGLSDRHQRLLKARLLDP